MRESQRVAAGEAEERSMDRPTPSVGDVVRRAVEICDPDDVDEALGRLEEQFEDDDEPVTAVENLDERLAIALEGADYEGENAAVAVASAVVRYLAEHPDEVDGDRNAEHVVRQAVRAQWHGDVPRYVDDWLAAR
jgi:hypothetical protein